MYHLIEARRTVQAFLDDGDEDVDGHGDPDLRLHCVLGCAEERLDAKVLFDPFEKQEGCPREHRKAKIDCGRVECVNRVFQLYAERFFGIEPLPDEVLSEIAVDAPVTRCAGIGQSVAGYLPRIPR